MVQRRSKQRTAEEAERKILLEGLEGARLGIARAYAGFNSAADPELIESFVYEINALQARYSYLLRQVKALDGVQPRPQSAGEGRLDLPTTLPGCRPGTGKGGAVWRHGWRNCPWS